MFRSGETVGSHALFAAAVCVSVANGRRPAAANELVGTWTLDLTKESELKGSQDKPNDVKLVFDGDGWKLTLVNEGGSQEVTADIKSTPRRRPSCSTSHIAKTTRRDPIYANIYELKGRSSPSAGGPTELVPADLSGTVFDGLLQVSFCGKAGVSPAGFDQASRCPRPVPVS